MAEPFDYESFDVTRLKDRNYTAQDYKLDPTIRKKDKRKERKCTDFMCAVIFITTLSLMGLCTMYAYFVGNPVKYMAPIDQFGNICGYSNSTKGFKKLYIPDIESAADNTAKMFQYGICV